MRGFRAACGWPAGRRLPVGRCVHCTWGLRACSEAPIPAFPQRGKGPIPPVRKGRALIRPIAAALSLLIAAGAALAQPKPQTLAACAACHGTDGNAPVAQFPSIAGQPRTFLENQLVLVREGLRDIPAMKEVMAGIDDAQIVELAKHYAAQPAKAPALTVNADKQRLGSQLATRMLCGTCHLADYAGQNQVPRLARQNEPYLLSSMKQFRDNPGPGRDTIMAATLRGLSDAELDQLAHYLATFK